MEGVAKNVAGSVVQQITEELIGDNRTASLSIFSGLGGAAVVGGSLGSLIAWLVTKANMTRDLKIINASPKLLTKANTDITNLYEATGCDK